MRREHRNGLRLLLLALLVGWFVSPPGWRYAVPLWLPFAIAAVLELEFAVSGFVRGAHGQPQTRGRAPQAGDLRRFGWEGEPPEEDDPAFWSSGPVRVPRSSPARRAVVPLLVLAAAGLVVWGVSVRRGWTSLPAGTQARVQHILSREAARIAGHSATVRCDTEGRHVGAIQDADGLAEVGGDDAWVTPGICFSLYRVIEGHTAHVGRGTGRAIAVLAHEAWHLRGVPDEGVANCYAFQSGVTVGTRLGLPPATARGLMRQQLADNADVGDARYVVPAGCRDGGRFDLHPSSHRFP